VRFPSRPLRVLPVLLAAVVWSACEDADDDPGAAAGAGGARAGAGAVAGGKASSTGGKGGSSAGAGKGGAGPGSDEREVSIRFRGKVLERELACDARFPGVGTKSTEVQPVDFRFFVQDLSLIDAEGNKVPVRVNERAPWQTPEVALIDLTDTSGTCVGTPETNAEIIGRVPNGQYTGVAFRNGVPEKLNHEDPVLHPPPLQVTDLAWSWLTGFRFLVAELHESEPAASADADAGTTGGVGLLHIGSTACKANMGCSHGNRNNVELKDFDPDRDVIVADLGALFTTSDLTQDVQCHASSDACAPLFERAGIDWKTGDGLSKQSLYRVEPAP